MTEENVLKFPTGDQQIQAAINSLGIEEPVLPAVPADETELEKIARGIEKTRGPYAGVASPVDQYLLANGLDQTKLDASHPSTRIAIVLDRQIDQIMYSLWDIDKHANIPKVSRKPLDIMHQKLLEAQDWLARAVGAATASQESVMKGTEATGGLTNVDTSAAAEVKA